MPPAEPAAGGDPPPAPGRRLRPVHAGFPGVIREALAIGRFVLGHPIGRRRPLRCLFDVARWQLTAGSEPRVVRFAGDARLLARRGVHGS